MNRSLLKDFENPPSQYRGKPFWAWNGKLEPQELRRQIRIMKKMGMGGFFMHSRVGLDTPYLSDEWFECVNSCIDEAKRQGMEAWLYDEDRWPSGAAGGLVTKNPAYRMRKLSVEVVDTFKASLWGEDIVAVFKATIDGANATNVVRLKKGENTRKGGKSFVVFREIVAEESSWYNGGTYVDTMNHAAVKEFIRITHEKYRRKIGNHFGKLVPGIFADEPNFHDGWYQQEQKMFPWSTTIPAAFKKRYGYDIVNHLVEIFFDVDAQQVSQPRYHYVDCCTFLFVDAFSRQIGEWCDKNGIAFTGHVLCEETLSSQTAKVGSAMRFYEHMQAPGMDILTQHNREYDTAKGVASVARQFGRKWRLSETYGCTGWDFPFTGHKAVGDWQAALGINLRTHHLAWYTMEGEAKRDYPAAIFYQSPWWQYYKTVEDYFSRVHALVGCGSEVRDVLVIHPVESAWLNVKVGWNKLPQTDAYDRMLITLRDTLLGATIDFDYGDEEILSRHGRVSGKKSEPTFVVGKAAYRVVVVPPLTTMRLSTLMLLEAFVAKGGTVVFAGSAATHVDALASTQVAELASRCPLAPAQGPQLVDAVEAKGRRISIRDSAGNQITSALYLLSESADSYYLFVCNTGHTFEMPAEWPIGDSRHETRTLTFENVVIEGFAECAGAPIECDPYTGTFCAADSDRENLTSPWSIRTSLPKLGSRLFLIPKKKSAQAVKPRVRLKDVRTDVLDFTKNPVRQSEPNVMVLDCPSYRIANGKQRAAAEILRIDTEVRQSLGLERRGGAMVQPWMQNKPQNPESVALELEFTFNVNDLPRGPVMFALEQAARFTILLNGCEIPTDTICGWWVDRSLQTLNLDPALFKTGSNSLVLTCRYDQNHPGLEIVYLLGDFGVTVDKSALTMVSAPSILTLGDWTQQRLPFYSGSVSYTAQCKPRAKAGDRVFVQVPDYRATAVRVLVDSKEAGIIGWEPNEIEITDLLSTGASTVTIELLGHRRNSHGPLHLSNREPGWTGPDEFKTQGEKWSDDYVLVACGLMQQPQIVVRRP